MLDSILCFLENLKLEKTLISLENYYFFYFIQIPYLTKQVKALDIFNIGQLWDNERMNVKKCIKWLYVAETTLIVMCMAGNSNIVS